MRVCLFHTLPEEGRTSSEVYARELASALESLPGPRVRVSHFEPRSRLRRALRRVAPVARVAGYVDRYLTYQWRARVCDADVSHVVDHGYGHLVYSLDPGRTVVTFHDAMLLKIRAREIPVESYPWFTILGHDLSLAAIRRATRVIADSTSSRNDLLRLTPVREERVRVVPLGVADRFLRSHENDGRQNGRPEGEAVRILHVGHCAPYKNIETILRAIPAICRRLGAPVVFIKVGGRFTRDQKALIGRLGIEDRVEHLGTVPLDDLPGVYARADLLLRPSLHEGFGLPAREAMACGTPVVVSNRGSLPEVVGDAGLLVEPHDIEGIARAAERLTTDAALRADLIRRGRLRARAFTWGRTARETLAVYEEVLRGSAPSC